MPTVMLPTASHPGTLMNSPTGTDSLFWTAHSTLPISQLRCWQIKQASKCQSGADLLKQISQHHGLTLECISIPALAKWSDSYIVRERRHIKEGLYWHQSQYSILLHQLQAPYRDNPKPPMKMSSTLHHQSLTSCWITRGRTPSSSVGRMAREPSIWHAFLTMWHYHSFRIVQNVGLRWWFSPQRAYHASMRTSVQILRGHT